MARSTALSLALPMDEATQPGEARRLAIALAEEIGLDEADRGRVALVVTEVATNLIKHARDGELLLRTIPGPPPALEVLALDRGPGMADLARCQADGYSTAGSSGNGLGAIARHSRTFEVHTTPHSGTALLARVGPSGKLPADDSGQVDFGAVNRPYPGETECGDSWAILSRPDGRVSVLVVDGLGHGPLAAQAAAEAVRAFLESTDRRPAAAIEAIHPRLKPTRGAALALADLDPRSQSLSYAGIGNIAGAILPADGSRARSLVTHNGIVGHEMRKVQEFPYPWPLGSTLVMSSDGLATHWRPESYPGLGRHHPALIAGLLYRDHRRTRDDVTVLAVRARSSS